MAVWGHLDNKTDLELILLKGHLLLEIVLDTTLARNEIKNSDNFSFYNKVLALEKINFKDKKTKKFVVYSLKKLNKIRNKLAHNFFFETNNGEFESWSQSIIENLKGTKYKRYTFRTKIVHSFSILSINILNVTK